MPPRRSAPKKKDDFIGSLSPFHAHITTVKCLIHRNYERRQEAFDMLKRIGTLVRPIMKARGWTVKTLREFYPTNPSLLGVNVNKGLEIRIRLRPASNKNSFLEFNDLIGTMLHELTHMVHGPHEAPFYKLLDDLWKEWELLVSSGWQGDGLDGPGNRLGQSHDLPEHLARQQALKSAEKRAKIGALMLVGGQTLGGASLQHWKALQKTLGPREMAARAAERRAADRLTCGQGHAATEIVTLDEEDTEMKPTEEDPGGDAEDEVVLVGVSHGTRKDAPCTSSSSSRPTKIIKQAHSANDTCCIIISSSSSGDDDV